MSTSTLRQGYAPFPHGSQRTTPRHVANLASRRAPGIDEFLKATSVGG